MLKKVKNLLKKFVDPMLLTRLPLPGVPWASKVYDPQFFAYRPKYLHVGLSHFGCMDVRVFAGGECIIAGIALASLDGASMKEKRGSVFHMAVDDLAKVIKTNGFIFKAVADSEIICLPSGFLYIEVCEEGCQGMRWSVSSDSGDSERVRENLVGMLDAYLGLKN